MALRKSLPTPQGLTATVWDIIRFEWNGTRGQSVVALYGWKDEDAMAENKQPLDTRVLSFSFPTFPYFSDVYDKVKESRLVLITPAIPAVMDGEIVITPEVPAVYEETNEFAGATRT